MTSKKRRVFLAIDLPMNVKQAIEQVTLELSEKAHAHPSMNVNWVPSQNFHLTLQFFGSVQEEQIPTLITLLNPILEKFTPFELEVQGMGAFPSEVRPRVFWVGLLDKSNVLQPMAQQIQTLLTRKDLDLPTAAQRSDEEFHPHITVGRIKEGRNAQSLLDPFRTKDFGKSMVSNITLYESQTLSTGSVYRPIQIFQLGGKASY